MLLMDCDFDGNQNIDACEIHACVVLTENDWRADNCPEYGDVYCDCPFVLAECDGAWDCNEVEAIVLDVIAYYDTNSD
jgi:hypothetical protein